MVLRGVNCHSAFAHYEMFHHCHGEGSLNSVFNYNTTYNIGSGVGVGGNFWTGLGYGIGNWFANLVGGGMFNGGGMFSGGMYFLNSHSDGNNGGKVVEDEDTPVIKDYQNKINSLDKSKPDEIKKLYKEIYDRWDKDDFADENNNEQAKSSYKVLLQDLRNKFPAMDFGVKDDKILKELENADLDNAKIKGYDAEIAGLKGLSGTDPDYNDKLNRAKAIYADCTNLSKTPEDETLGIQNRDAYLGLMTKLENLFGKDKLAAPASSTAEEIDNPSELQGSNGELKKDPIVDPISVQEVGDPDADDLLAGYEKEIEALEAKKKGNPSQGLTKPDISRAIVIKAACEELAAKKPENKDKCNELIGRIEDLLKDPQKETSVPNNNEQGGKIGTGVVATPHLVLDDEHPEFYDVSFVGLSEDEITKILEKGLKLIKEIDGSTSDIEVAKASQPIATVTKNSDGTITAEVTVKSEVEKRTYTYTFTKTEDGKVYFHGNSKTQEYVLQYNKTEEQYQLNQYSNFSGHGSGDGPHISEI